MHQPPLYYAASAVLLDAGGLSVSDNDAAFLLRTVNGVVGWFIAGWCCFACDCCLRTILLPKRRDC